MIERKQLKEEAKQLGIMLSETQTEKLDRFAEILVEYNQTVNLTSIVKPDEIRRKHFIDSLLITVAVDLQQIHTMVDVGAGAGFPSIPLAIYCPELQVIQLDSSLKRVTFLNYAARELGLQTQARHIRAEEAGRQESFREQFDLCVARAVAPMPQLVEYCLPLVRVGGWFCAMKAKRCEEEKQAAETGIRLLGGKILAEKEWEIPQAGIRKLLLIKKEKKTPALYPRNSKRIRNNPL